MADGVRFLPINLADSKEMLTFATSYIDVWWLVSCGTLVAIITLYAAYKAYVISKKQN